MWPLTLVVIDVFSASSCGPTKTGTASSKLVIQYIHLSCMSSSNIYWLLQLFIHIIQFSISIHIILCVQSCYFFQIFYELLRNCRVSGCSHHPAMAAGYIAPYYPSTTEEEVAENTNGLEEGCFSLSGQTKTLQKDFCFWLSSVKREQVSRIMKYERYNYGFYFCWEPRNGLEMRQVTSSYLIFGHFRLTFSAAKC